MSTTEDVFKTDWLIELNVRPDEMSCEDPPRLIPFDEEHSRLLNSLLSLTLTETFVDHQIDEYLHEHIQMEKLYSKEKNFQLIWSDEVSLTFCFLASLAHRGDYYRDDILQRYFQWWMNGYMCPTGLCFTPHVNFKKSIDLFGESQAAHALGIDIDWEKRTSKLHLTGCALLRLSPIAYFYRKDSKEKRGEILEDLSKRMFGNLSSLDLLHCYIEILVEALNGHSKQSILQSIQLKDVSTNSIGEILFELIHLIENDENEMDIGIAKCLQIIERKKPFFQEEQCRYLNPFDSNRTILLTLYLQLSSALYNTRAKSSSKNLYAQSMIESLTKWIIYHTDRRLTFN